MTKDEVLELMARLRELAADARDRGEIDLAAKLRSFADELDTDISAGRIPF
jgi:hypothetical protein